MSRLYERMMQPCVMRVKTSVPDTEGGQRVTWADGGTLQAAIVKDTDFASRMAQKSTETATYTLTTAQPLGFHAVVKRVSDGAVFRVTSADTDSAPPAEASFAFYQVTAERWAET